MISGFCPNLSRRTLATVLPPSFLIIFLNSATSSSLIWSSASLTVVLPGVPTADSFIVNGQLGVVVEVLKGGMVVNFDDELIYVGKHKLKNILLGSILSIHKSQGSSVDYTISVVGKSQSRMITRGLLYVETTRCRKSHVDIGDIQTFVDGLEIVDNDLKNTFLKEMMTNE